MTLKRNGLEENNHLQSGHTIEDIEEIRRTLDAEIREFNKDKRQLEREKKELKRRTETERARLAQEKQLFTMKWKLLEEEVRKLAYERQRVEKQKIFYERMSEFERKSNENTDISVKVVRGDLFFAGVTSELALKKRYKDLIKIYHPDNVSGDTNTVQEINREYDKLKNRLESC